MCVCVCTTNPMTFDTDHRSRNFWRISLEKTQGGKHSSALISDTNTNLEW